jgi:hypothetical protein
MPGNTIASKDFSGLKELSSLLGCRWKNLEAAREKTAQVIDLLTDLIGRVPGPISDTSIVLNGSLARFECTHGSDLDWTLLVDAQAKPTTKRIYSASGVPLMRRLPEVLGRLSANWD